MAKNLLLNASTRNIQDVYMLKYRDLGGTEHWFQRVNKSRAEEAESADLQVQLPQGGGFGPEWGVTCFLKIDFTQKSNVTPVGSSSSTVVYEGYPVSGYNNDTYYLPDYNGSSAVVWYESWQSAYTKVNFHSYHVQFQNIPAVLWKPNFWVEQIQRGSKSLTSVFPGVTYKVSTEEVTFNPMYTDPYTVEIWYSGALLDTYVDCDKYFCEKASSLAYNHIYYSDLGGDGQYDFADYILSEYEIEHEYHEWRAIIQYSTSTSGDSDWTDIGFYRPFPDNTKRLKITITDEPDPNQV